jgi:MOSC domain-containing protein YiiM
MSRLGSIHQVNTSDGGVPKLPIPIAEIGYRGVVGDRQADRVHHGSPDQALCLYSLEVIEALQAEGHPIEPGSAGENLTMAGIDWGLIGIGARLKVGRDVELEVTGVTEPCSKNAAWFVGGDFRRMAEDRHPGSSRWYAKVITAGMVDAGDRVEIVG